MKNGSFCLIIVYIYVNIVVNRKDDDDEAAHSDHETQRFKAG